MPVFIVDKPLNMSSHDVVSRARKLLKTRRVGHAGTLDPLATGVLVLLTEEATKLSPFLTASSKHYLAWISFGASTPTLDAEGPIDHYSNALELTTDEIAAALPPFLSLSEQLPPQYSAIKKGGVKGYEAARQGKKLELSARAAGYEQMTLLDFAAKRENLAQHFGFSAEHQDWRPQPQGISFALPETLGDFPTALFSLKVTAGTYIRAFARDLGASLGQAAHLSGLVRTRAGKNGLEQAIKLKDIATAPGLSMTEALPYPLIGLNERDSQRVRQGQRLSLELDERVGLIDPEQKLVAVAETQQGKMRLLRVWQDQ